MTPTVRTGKSAPATDDEIRAARVLGDPRWLLLTTRSRAADGTFLYSVRSTGVYCRPSCAARTPRPENVDFHADAAAAERAGFRPCRRCQPARSAVESLAAHDARVRDVACS